MRILKLFTLLLAGGLAGPGLTFQEAGASTVLGPWIPLFQGIDHAVGTNTPGEGGLDRLQVIHAIRVDLGDPDVRLFASPPLENPVPGDQETAGRTVKDFLSTHGLQLAINVNAFSPEQYYLPAGTPMDILGFLVSEGKVVSEQTSAEHAATVLFTANNEATIVHTNWPALQDPAIYTAVSGEYPVVVQGVNVGFDYLRRPEHIHGVNPRTAFGLSEDRRTLYLLTIDGRQPGYSDGALDWETADWMLRLGAHDAVNMDGGGSTTLVMADATGTAVEMNRSSAVADSGKERTVGAHFGLYARPALGFINDVAATPDDTTASIRWTTVDPATTQVEYGTTADLGALTPPDATLTTNHAAQLAGLSPDTTYYFAVISATDSATHRSATYRFTTTNYVTLDRVIEFTNDWKYVTRSLDGESWTSRTYDDSNWSGPGPGLLWIDVRPSGPNPEVQPKGAPLPENQDNSGFPYVTYYFRKRFDLRDAVPGATLRFSCYVDDGAVFYLNGVEIHRINMPEAPEPVLNNTLATGYSFDGDATATLDFILSGAPADLVVPGENVVAVEVHNYNVLSADVTFGLALTYARPSAPIPRLTIATAGPTITVSWERAGFTLQQADFPTGPWNDVPGQIVSSPYATAVDGATRYFRLRQ